ncbi:MAG TPA: PEP-CTERM sorting domain-containing protein [Pirellulales bacterium]|jgi:T5SS/PEP-CTERM-associated repeat protein|nr:PEP-CTERM sorting domain-containing protein [Pirellulales bacterium]
MNAANQQFGIVTNNDTSLAALSFAANTGTVTLTQLIGAGSSIFAANASVSTFASGAATIAGTATITTMSSGSVTAQSFAAPAAGFHFNGGTLTVSGGAYSQSSGPLTIDGTNNPTLVLAAGATLSGVTALNVGNGNGGSFHDTSNYTVGAAGVPASLAVQNGGIATFDGTLSMASGGTLTLDTGGAIIATNFDATTGTFNFNGGTLTVSSGSYTQSSGPLTIDGANSPALVLASGATTSGVTSAIIGNAATGALSVLGGSALAFGGDASLGALAGSYGVASVSGAGSTWTIGGNLYLGGSSAGAGGTGMLTVDTGGTVSVAGTYELYGGSTLSIGSGGTFTAASLLAPGEITNNGAIHGNVTIQSGGTLAGTGTITGDVVQQAGSVYSPGNSPGMQTVNGDVTWNSMTYSEQIANATGAAGTGYDSLAVLAFGSETGSLTIVPGSTIDVDVAAYPTSTSSVQNFTSSSSYDFILVTAAGGITGTNSATFVIDTSGFTPGNPLNGGTFSIFESANMQELMLHYAPANVPEPASLALVGLAASAWAGSRWRRRKRGRESGIGIQ